VEEFVVMTISGLVPPILFSLGYLNPCVYANNPHIFEELNKTLKGK
jgi:hypothetical protein